MKGCVIILLLFVSLNTSIAQSTTTNRLLSIIRNDYVYDASKDHIEVKKIFEVDSSLTKQEIYSRIKKYLSSQSLSVNLDPELFRISFKHIEKDVHLVSKNFNRFRYDLDYKVIIDIKNGRVRIKSYPENYRMNNYNKVTQSTFEELQDITMTYPIHPTMAKNLQGVVFYHSINFLKKQQIEIIDACKKEVEKIDDDW